MIKNIKKKIPGFLRKLGALAICTAIALSTAQAAFASPEDKGQGEKKTEEVKSPENAGTETARKEEGTASGSSASKEPEMVSMPKLSEQEFAGMSAEWQDAVSQTRGDPKKPQKVEQSGNRLVKAIQKAVNGEGDNTIPTEGGGHRIEDVRVRWITGNNPDHCISRPSDQKPFSIKGRIDVALSGQDDYPAGTFYVSIPKTIWQDRDGEPAGVMDLSVPKAPNNRREYAYAETEDSYVITNTIDLSAASEMFFEFSIDSLYPLELIDLFKEYKTDDFFALAEVVNDEGFLISMESNHIDAQVDTESRVTRAYKSTTNVYLSWPKGWKSEMKPENPSAYVYVDWYVYAYVAGNQYYSIDIEDSYDDPNVEGEILLRRPFLSIRSNQIMTTAH